MNDPQAFRIYRFHPEGLDPVTVYVEQYRPGSSRMTVQCYAQAWTAYWGSHGHNPLEEFVCGCHAEYVADGLMWGNNGLILKRRERHHHEYVVRIVCAIQAAFREAMREAASRDEELRKLANDILDGALS